METLLTLAMHVVLKGSRHLRVDRGDPDEQSERGATVLEWAGLGAISIAVILVLGAAMQAMGLNVINWIQTQLIGS